MIPQISAFAAAALAAWATFLAGSVAAAAWSRARRQTRFFRQAVLGRLARLHDRTLPAAVRERIEAALLRAGNPGDLRAGELAGVVELGAASGLAAALALIAGCDAPLLAAPAAAAFGGALPILWLHDRAAARRAAIVRALPHAADLLTLAVEAGLDFAAALAKVAEKGRGPLHAELSTALKELRFGKTREEALRGLAFRAAVPAVSSFVQALLHADRIGTPLGRVLRALSTQMRVERAQRAEKLANEAPVKLLFPLLAFIFPTLFLMLFGPIAYQVVFGGEL
jgi:tight adherence protein C